MNMKFARTMATLPRPLYLLAKPVVIVAFHVSLSRLIVHNYRMRAMCAILKKYRAFTKDMRDYPDEWYWADYLSASYGLFVSYESKRDQWITRHCQRIGINPEGQQE